MDSDVALGKKFSGLFRIILAFALFDVRVVIPRHCFELLVVAESVDRMATLACHIKLFIAVYELLC